MGIRTVIMIGAVALTLIFPTALAFFRSQSPKLRRHLLGLPLGLLAQIAAEVSLIGSGHRAWVARFASVCVALRLVQLVYLFGQRRGLASTKRILFLTLVGLNLSFWAVIEVKLLMR